MVKHLTYKESSPAKKNMFSYRVKIDLDTKLETNK